MREAKKRCHVAVAASNVQIVRMRRAIDASRMQIDLTTDRIQQSERLLARTGANEHVHHGPAQPGAPYQV